MKRTFNLLTILLTTSTTMIITTNNTQTSYHHNLIQNETAHKNNIDYRNVNWDFSSNIPDNNEEVKINANVDWSQWDSSIPSEPTNILSIDVKIDKTKLQTNNTLGHLMDYLNNYADKTLNAYQPFWMSFNTQYGRSLLGVWDITKHWEVSGWQNNYWKIENYEVGIDNITLEKQQTINLNFLRIN
ncbi:hypothetical protein [Spiroplasma sp. AdecLV25b]|uniref:hypothetical protein n=1 Tax=Spiroplasma sp. AdecLV25b TaxID=3027162 RepID=UPI0027E0D477|nr:hypothetical protein [Spiroplasma sp. AdecLV25b]